MSPSPNDALLPRQVGPVVLGDVEAMEGPGARECPEYVPTVQELRWLAAQWLREWVAAQLEDFFCGSSRPLDFSMANLAMARLDRIAGVIGTEEINRVRVEVDREVKYRLGPKLWHIFSTYDGVVWQDRWAEIRVELGRQAHDTRYRQELDRWREEERQRERREDQRRWDGENPSPLDNV
jgi:hypothetical protein